MSFEAKDRIMVDDRCILLTTGTRSQTLRVPYGDGSEGWESEWRLSSPPFLTTEEVEACGTLAELTRVLVADFHAAPIITVIGVGTPVPPSVLSASDEGWVEAANISVRTAIDQIVGEFVDQPYKHRVEHSLHVHLFQLLEKCPLFGAKAALGRYGQFTGHIHKEWPETRPRPGSLNRRGNYDLAIIPPDLFRDASTLDFCEGRIYAPIAIELGLNYGSKHLKSDDFKLTNSRVRHAYLVHFERENSYERATVDHVNSMRSSSGNNVVYARVAPDNRGVKLLGDPEIRALP